MLPTSSFVPSGNRKTAIRLQLDDDINVCFSLSRALCLYPVVYIQIKGENEKHSTRILNFVNFVTVQPCDWQKREIEKVFSSDYPHGNT